MDQGVWASEPYTRRTTSSNTVRAAQRLGPAIYADAQSYVTGINAYIQKAEQPAVRLTMLPAEYAAIGQPGGPQPFTLTDLIRSRRSSAGSSATAAAAS